MSSRASSSPRGRDPPEKLSNEARKVSQTPVIPLMRFTNTSQPSTPYNSAGRLGKNSRKNGSTEGTPSKRPHLFVDDGENVEDPNSKRPKMATYGGKNNKLLSMLRKRMKTTSRPSSTSPQPQLEPYTTSPVTPNRKSQVHAPIVKISKTSSTKSPTTAQRKAKETQIVQDKPSSNSTRNPSNNTPKSILSSNPVNATASPDAKSTQKVRPKSPPKPAVTPKSSPNKRLSFLETLKGFISSKSKVDSNQKANHNPSAAVNSEGNQKHSNETEVAPNGNAHVTSSQPIIARSKNPNTSLVRSASTKETTVAAQKTLPKPQTTLDIIKLARSQPGTNITNAISVSNDSYSEDESSSNKEKSPKSMAATTSAKSNAVTNSTNHAPVQKINNAVTQESKTPTNNVDGAIQAKHQLGISKETSQKVKELQMIAKGAQGKKTEMMKSNIEARNVDNTLNTLQVPSEDFQKNKADEINGTTTVSDVNETRNFSPATQPNEKSQEVVTNSTKSLPTTKETDTGKLLPKALDNGASTSKETTGTQKTSINFITSQPTLDSSAQSTTATVSSSAVSDAQESALKSSKSANEVASQVPFDGARSRKRPHDAVETNHGQKQDLANRESYKVQKTNIANETRDNLSPEASKAVTGTFNRGSKAVHNPPLQKMQEIIHSSDVLNTQLPSGPETSSNNHMPKDNEMINIQSSEKNNIDHSSTLSSLDTQLANELAERTKKQTDRSSDNSDTSSVSSNSSHQRDSSEIESSASSAGLSDSPDDSDASRNDVVDSDAQDHIIAVKQEEPTFNILKDSIVGDVGNNITSNFHSNMNNRNVTTAQQPATMEVIYISDSDDEDEGDESPASPTDEESSEDGSSLSDVGDEEDNNDHLIFSQNSQETGNLDIKGPADEIDAQRASFERKLHKNAMDLLIPQKSQKHNDMIPLIESGVIKHTGFVKSRLISATNNITTCNNIESSPALYYQQSHKRDRVRELDIPGSFTKEFLEKGSYLCPVDPIVKQGTNLNPHVELDKNGSVDKNDQISTQIIKSALEDIRKNNVEVSKTPDSTETKNTPNSAGQSSQNDAGANKGLEIVAQLIKGNNNQLTSREGDRQLNENKTKGYLKRKNERQNNNTALKESDGASQSEEIVEMQRSNTSLKETNSIEEIEEIDEASDENIVPKTPQTPVNAVKSNNPDNSDNVNEVITSPAANSSDESPGVESNRKLQVPSTNTIQENYHTEVQGAIQSPSEEVNTQLTKQRQMDTGDAEDNNNTKQIKSPESHNTGEERESTRGRNGKVHPENATNLTNNEARSVTSAIAKYVLEHENSSNLAVPLSKEEWRREWLNSLKISSFYPYPGYSSTQLSASDKKNIDTAFDHITHILQSKYGARILKSPESRPNTILLKGKIRDFERDGTLRGIINTFQDSDNGKRIRLWSLSKVTKFLENMETIGSSTRSEHHRSDTHEVINPPGNIPTTDSVIIQSQELPEDIDQTVPNVNINNNSESNTDIQNVMNVQQDNNDIIDSGKYVEEITNMISDLENRLSDAYNELNKEKSEHQQAENTIYELSNQILQQNMLTASLNARLELRNAENAILREQLDLLRKKHSEDK